MDAMLGPSTRSLPQSSGIHEYPGETPTGNDTAQKSTGSRSGLFSGGRPKKGIRESPGSTRSARGISRPPERIDTCTRPSSRGQLPREKTDSTSKLLTDKEMSLEKRRLILTLFFRIIQENFFYFAVRISTGRKSEKNTTRPLTTWSPVVPEEVIQYEIRSHCLFQDLFFPCVREKISIWRNRSEKG